MLRKDWAQEKFVFLPVAQPDAGPESPGRRPVEQNRWLMQAGSKISGAP